MSVDLIERRKLADKENDTALEQLHAMIANKSNGADDRAASIYNKLEQSTRQRAELKTVVEQMRTTEQSTTLSEKERIDLARKCQKLAKEVDSLKVRNDQLLEDQTTTQEIQQRMNIANRACSTHVSKALSVEMVCELFNSIIGLAVDKVILLDDGNIAADLTLTNTTSMASSSAPLKFSLIVNPDIEVQDVKIDAVLSSKQTQLEAVKSELLKTSDTREFIVQLRKIYFGKHV